MNRRGFLRACGIGAAAVVVPVTVYNNPTVDFYGFLRQVAPIAKLAGLSVEEMTAVTRKIALNLITGRR